MLALDGLFNESTRVIGPFMTGPMLVASNFTGHPCLHLRAGFLELGTRSAASLGAGKLTTGEPDQRAGAFGFRRASRSGGGCSRRDRILNLGMALERALGVAALRPAISRLRRSRPITI